MPLLVQILTNPLDIHNHDAAAFLMDDQASGGALHVNQNEREQLPDDVPIVVDLDLGFFLRSGQHGGATSSATASCSANEA